MSQVESLQPSEHRSGAKLALMRRLTEFIYWFLTPFDRRWILSVINTSKKTAARIWRGQQDLSDMDQIMMEQPPENFSARVAVTTSLRTDLHADVKQFVDAPFTNAYAEYLGLHLTKLHCEIGDRVKNKESVPPQIKNFIIFQIRALAINPLARHDQCIALVPYLDYRSPEIAQAALCSFKKLAKRRPSVTVIKAEIEWFDLEVSVVRFEHPSLGVVEREFEAEALPPGAEMGDCFELGIELDAIGRVIAYQPRRDRLEKRVSAEWEKVPTPTPPGNLDDSEAMARYNEAMKQYMAQTTEMRARDVERWRATRKSN